MSGSRGWICGPLIECLPGMHETLGSIPYTLKNKNKIHIYMKRSYVDGFSKNNLKLYLTWWWIEYRKEAKEPIEDDLPQEIKLVFKITLFWIVLENMQTWSIIFTSALLCITENFVERVNNPCVHILISCIFLDSLLQLNHHSSWILLAIFMPPKTMVTAHSSAGQNPGVLYQSYIPSSCIQYNWATDYLFNVLS